MEGNKVSFVKDYKDGSHTNIKYDGVMETDHIEGQYSFLFKSFVINMNVQEKFYMKLVVWVIKIAVINSEMKNTFY